MRHPIYPKIDCIFKDTLEHGGISLLELRKFAARAIETEEERWLKFFKDGGRLDVDRLPD